MESGTHANYEKFFAEAKREATNSERLLDDKYSAKYFPDGSYEQLVRAIDFLQHEEGFESIKRESHQDVGHSPFFPPLLPSHGESGLINLLYQ
jgi:hypothetical protein